MLIIDPNLNNHAGINILSAIRVNWRILPIVVLSELPFSPFTMQVFNAGADDYLLKPFNLAEVSALLIDCRSLDTELIPLPASTCVVVMDTGTRRGQTGLIDSAYNDRRKECETAAQIMGVSFLRDASTDMLDHCADTLGSLLYRRTRHVIS